MTPTPKNSTNFTALDRLTVDGTARNIEGLSLLFPEVITETLDDNGRPTKAVNFDALRQLFSDHLVDSSKERYELTWPGKQQARFTAHQPIAKTLRPNRSESVDFDTTQNLFIEGDNLDALKILRNSYLGKVKLIYIDPPYNTGNDFVYKDDFGSTRTEYLFAAEESDEEGGRLVSNTSSNGRFHSDWLSMVYPRLLVAKDLISEDGIIFISIDDNEFHNLKSICEEIFGSTNYFADLIVIRSEGGGMAKNVVKGHDYLLAISKNISAFKGIRKAKDIRGKIVNIDSKEFWIETDWLRQEFGTYGNLHYEDIEKFKGLDKLNEINDGIARGSYKLIPQKNGKHLVGRLREVATDGSKFYSVIKHLNKTGSDSISSIGMGDYFSNPKPISLIEEIIMGATRFTSNQNDIILDFFGGSGTTAHATYRCNAADGGNRKFILVQIQEDLYKNLTVAKTKAEKIKIESGIKHLISLGKEPYISNLTLERIHLAGKFYSEKIDDSGCRKFFVDDSNFANNFAAADALTQDDLLGQLSSVKTGRTGEDLLFQTLLSLGLPLDVDIKTLKIAGAEVYSVAGGSLLACFEPDLNDALVTALAEYARDYAKDELIPVDYLVLLDSAFETDASRINAGQIFNQLSPETSLRVI